MSNSEQESKVTSTANDGTYTPATENQKIGLAILLFSVSVLLVYYWITLVSALDDRLHQKTRVAWTAGADVTLLPGPPTFYMDREKKELVFIGSIDNETKRQLLELLDTKDKAKKPLSASYIVAIDQLAFHAHETLTGLMLSLIWLGGLSGFLGVQLRSMIDFVGQACMTGKLDVSRWWPWYFIRPVSGFIMGVFAILLIHTGLLSVTAGDLGNNMWLVTFAVLAGFGADDFAQRLRLLSKTLFGH